MSELNNQIRSLQEVHGTEKLLAAATEILGKKVPTDYVRVLDPLELQASLQQIDPQYRMFWKRVRHVKKLMVKSVAH